MTSCPFYRSIFLRKGTCALFQMSQCLNNHTVANNIGHNVIHEESKNSKKPFVIAVEGNIGSGKSTLVNYFQQFSDVEATQEQVHQWCNMRGHNLLGMLYDNPRRNSFMFQHYIQYNRLAIRLKPCSKRIKVMERSLQNNRYCFIENALDNKDITDAEYGVLSDWYSWMENNLDIHLDLIVYLHTKPNIVYERMKQRARPEEKGVPLEYMHTLHDSYERWLTKQSPFPIPAPVVVLDANQDLENMYQQFKNLKDQVWEKAKIIS